MNDDKLLEFARDSNLIERVDDERADLAHAAALKKLLAQEDVRIEHLDEFVKGVEPQAFLRTAPGQDVAIGGRLGLDPLQVTQALRDLLADIQCHHVGPWEAHARYEAIHPFIDCNGRSGRALWLWQMMWVEESGWDFQFGFLHFWYYQSLSFYSDLGR